MTWLFRDRRAWGEDYGDTLSTYFCNKERVSPNGRCRKPPGPWGNNWSEMETGLWTRAGFHQQWEKGAELIGKLSLHSSMWHHFKSWLSLQYSLLSMHFLLSAKFLNPCQIGPELTGERLTRDLTPNPPTSLAQGDQEPTRQGKGPLPGGQGYKNQCFSLLREKSAWPS